MTTVAESRVGASEARLRLLRDGGDRPSAKDEHHTGGTAGDTHRQLTVLTRVGHLGEPFFMIRTRRGGCDISWAWCAAPLEQPHKSEAIAILNAARH